MNAESELRTLEYDLWDAVKRRDPGRFEQLLTADFVYLDESGISGKDILLGMLPTVTLHAFQMEDVRVTFLSPDIGVVVYCIDEDVPAAPGNEAGRRTAVVSSVWTRHNGAWTLAIHQETPQASHSEAGSS
jgi:hypothetical protein